MKISEKQKKLDLQMTMTRPLGGGTRDKFLLRIEDEASGLYVMEIEIDFEGFADLHSSTSAKASGTLFTDDRIGKKHENISVYLEVKQTISSPADMKKINEAADAWEEENPGWTIDRDRHWNRYRWDHKTGTYRVIARRWI